MISDEIEFDRIAALFDERHITARDAARRCGVAISSFYARYQRWLVGRATGAGRPRSLRLVDKVEIRKLYESGTPVRVLAEQYRVSESTIRRVLT